MAWEDVLAGIGGGMQGLAKGLSWQQEMEQEEAKRKALEANQMRDDQMRREEHNLRMTTLQDQKKQNALEMAVKFAEYNSPDTPLPPSLAQQLRESGAGALLIDKPGQLPSRTPSWASIPEMSSPGIAGGTYRLPNAMERKAAGEAQAQAKTDAMVKAALAAMTPPQREMFANAFAFKQGAGASVTTPEEAIKSPAQLEKERNEKLDYEGKLIGKRAGAERGTIKYRDELERKQKSDEAAGIIPQPKPKPYTPMSDLEKKDKEWLKNLDDRSKVFFEQWKRDHPEASASETALAAYTAQAMNAAGVGTTPGITPQPQPQPPPQPPGQMPNVMPTPAAPQVSDRPYGNYPGPGAAPPVEPPMAVTPGGVPGGAPQPAPAAPTSPGGRRPAAVGDELTFPDGSKRRWTGAKWVPILPPAQKRNP